MELFKFGLPITDLKILKSMNPEQLEAAGINVEELEKSIESDLVKGKEGLVPEKKMVTRGGRQVETTVYVRADKNEKKGDSGVKSKTFSHKDVKVGDTVHYEANNAHKTKLSGKVESVKDGKIKVRHDSDSKGKTGSTFNFDVGEHQVTHHNGKEVKRTEKKEAPKKEAPKKAEPKKEAPKKEADKKKTSGMSADDLHGSTWRSNDEKEGLMHVEKRKDGIYMRNDKFDHTAKDADEAVKTLKKWGYKHIGYN